MFLCRFGVKVSDDFAIVKCHVDIEKGYGCEGIVACEFYGGVNVIEKGSECAKPMASFVRITDYRLL